MNVKKMFKYIFFHYELIYIYVNKKINKLISYEKLLFSFNHTGSEEDHCFFCICLSIDLYNLYFWCNLKKNNT